MLVLSRKTSEQIRIGPDILITVVRIGGNMVRLGIDAPGDVAIMREELLVDSTDEHVEQLVAALSGQSPR